MNNMNLLDSILNLLYPERCLFCRNVLSGSNLKPLCLVCGNNFEVTGAICPVCEQQSSTLRECKCLPQNYPLKSLTALCFYENRWRDLLHDLKYRKKRSLARPLGAWLGREINSCPDIKPTVVTYVPLHRFREQERGFNQSELIARNVAKVLGIPCETLLERTRNTPSQTTVSRVERRENISGAFRSLNKSTRNAAILLVDDIYSTGSTMKEAASVLKHKGASVYGAVIAFNRRYRF